MSESQNRENSDLSREKRVINNNLPNSCSVTYPNFYYKNGNSISFALIISAVCISLVRYFLTSVPNTNSVTEIKNNVVNYVDIENTEIEDTEFDEDEEWEDEEEILENDTPTKTNKNNGFIVFEKGDTLAKVLERLEINKSDIHGASVAVSRVFQLKKMKPGLQILVKSDDNDKSSLRYLEFKPDRRFKIVVEKVNKRFIAKKITVPLKRTLKKVSGVISPKAPVSSLQHCGLQKPMVHDALKALGHVANISNTKSKVSFNLVYEQYHTENNELLDSNMLAIVASVDGKIRKVYKFSIDGSMQYIDSTGRILNTQKRGSMFIKPVAYKKITSQFGYRYHPISGRSKMHTGIDLSASIGTPVRATASGRVVMAQHYRGYGRYIKISHLGGYSTAYAHLSRVIVIPGQVVKQGQVIGYSGNSGYSTGAHLHYEVIQNGKFINPLLFVPQPPQRLTGKDLVKFNSFKKSIDLNVTRTV